MLTDHVVIVTGGAQGIGRATAQRCAELGADVVIADLDGDRAAGAARAIAEQTGRRAIGVAANASVRGDLQGTIEHAVGTLGRLDGLVCGGMRRIYQPAEDFTDEAWDLVVGEGLTGYFRAAQEAARVMLAQGSGSIVFVTSIAGRVAVTGGAAYAAAKAGIAGLTRQLGVEWAPRGVRVNALAPGFTESEGAIQRLDPRRAQQLIPLGAPARPEDIAGVAAFLLSPASSQMTGQELVVDGGLVIGGVFGEAAVAAHGGR